MLIIHRRFDDCPDCSLPPQRLSCFTPDLDKGYDLRARRDNQVRIWTVMSLLVSHICSVTSVFSLTGFLLARICFPAFLPLEQSRSSKGPKLDQKLSV